MNREYQKPEVELISLVSMEAISSGDEVVDGEMGLSDSIFD